MKRNDDSLHWQNIQLYSFGILFNGMGLVVNNISAGRGIDDLLKQVVQASYWPPLTALCSDQLLLEGCMYRLLQTLSQCTAFCKYCSKDRAKAQAHYTCRNICPSTCSRSCLDNAKSWIVLRVKGGKRYMNKCNTAQVKEFGWAICSRATTR